MFSFEGHGFIVWIECFTLGVKLGLESQGQGLGASVFLLWPREYNLAWKSVVVGKPVSLKSLDAEDGLEAEMHFEQIYNNLAIYVAVSSLTRYWGGSF